VFTGKRPFEILLRVSQQLRRLTEERRVPLKTDSTLPLHTELRVTGESKGKNCEKQVQVPKLRG
jgi:hypothetical protein